MMQFNLFNGDCLDVLKTLPDNSVDSIVTDPPYGLSNQSQDDIVKCLTAWLADEAYTHGSSGFMGKNWDSFVPSPTVWKECLRVLKHGGYIACFAGSRTQDLMGISLRLAGFELRDTIMWVYGCLSEDTEILTSKGWKRYHKTIEEDSVLCYNKNSDSFEFHQPTKSFNYENKHTAYSIKSDFTDQIVSRNHRVLVERGGSLEFISAEALERKENIPFLESLHCLPKSVHDIYEGTSNKKKNLFKKVSRGNDIKKENREKNTEQKRMYCLQDNVLPNLSIRQQTESCLFSSMQRCIKGGGMESSCTQGSCVLEGGEQTGIEKTNDWFDKSKLEGWGNLPQPQGAICHTENKVCEVSNRIHSNGKGRRLCNGTSPIGCNEDTETISKNGSSSSYQPRRNRQQPAELDAIQNECGTQTIRTRKAYSSTLATITPIEYKGNVWCVTVPTGAFVARRNGKIFITGNSGFPKGLDIAKGIDGVLGNQSTSIITSGNDGKKAKFQNGGQGKGYQKHLEYKPSEKAKQWEGWNTQLKPAYEPIILARKPLDGTVVNNVLKYGIGGLNIGACRVYTNENIDRSQSKPRKTSLNTYGKANPAINPPSSLGRYPANLIHDGSESVEALFPETPARQASQASQASQRRKLKYETMGKLALERSAWNAVEDYQGSASRYFYCAKASKADRDEGLKDRNTHSTVKPTALMQYVTKLITPLNGTVLDPFMGSGSTGKACMLEVFNFTGIELNPEYLTIAEARIKHAQSLASRKQLKLDV